MPLNFEQLAAKFRESETRRIVKTRFGEVALQRVSPDQLLRLGQLSQSARAAAESGDDEFEQRTLFMREMIAQTAVDDDGRRMLLSDEGRQLIAQFDVVDLLALGNAALEVNGLTDLTSKAEEDAAKKN